MSHLRYGVYLPPFGPFGDPRTIVDLAVRAEAAGWDGVFLWDHVVGQESPIVDSWMTLSAIAAATERIVLGATVTPLPRRRPWVLARQVSTVSQRAATCDGIFPISDRPMQAEEVAGILDRLHQAGSKPIGPTTSSWPETRAMPGSARTPTTRTLRPSPRAVQCGGWNHSFTSTRWSSHSRWLTQVHRVFQMRI